MEIAFGPGLNVLYGPNDLGKSTLAEAIRLALLLPHTSSSYEPYIPWSGADDPLVDLVFETEAQRIWRVQKRFGKRGSALLQESRNGQDFDDVERARKVDEKLREILRWGLPGPVGAGAGRGLPTSFLATALLSTQANVSDVLYGSLHSDPAATGREQIAAALQAVAQDPLFVALLRQIQARRDEAYTDKGAKSRAQGSVFKIAADRVKEARKEKEDLEKIVEESEGVERRLRELEDRRAQCDEEYAAAEERLVSVQLLAQQAADRAAAWANAETARAGVQRIQKMDQDVAEAEQEVRELAGVKEQAEQELKKAQADEVSAGEALAATEEGVAGLGSDMADTVARQALELRKATAEQAEQAARQKVEAMAGAQDLVDAASRAEEEHRKQEAEVARARERRAEAAKAEQAANEALRRCDLLERGLAARAAEKQASKAQADVEREAALQAELTRVLGKREALVERRAAIVVPPAGSLAALRKLDTDLASARGALEVGLVLTVIPTAIVHLRARKDGVVVDPGVIAQPWEVEADTEVEVDVADLATVRVRGGRREAQQRVRTLESHWEGEVLPHLTAAGVTDLEALQTRVAEAKELDSQIQALDGKLEPWQRQLAELASAAEALREASARVAACRLELVDVTPEALAADLDALGPDPGTALRARRQRESREEGEARTAAHQAATDQAVAEERAGSLRESLEMAVAKRDTALSEFPAGVSAGREAAEEELQDSLQEQERVTAELGALQGRIEARRREVEVAVGEARLVREAAQRVVEAAQEGVKKAIADLAAAGGRLGTLRELRNAEDLSAAERAFHEATERHEALLVPERLIGPDEVTAARDALERARRELTAVTQDVLTMQGRLQQVGGAVAHDRLREAIEAHELAEAYEREVELDYEGWKLLLEQMKEADAAQASNLGKALAPAIEDRFRDLTRERYRSIQLTAHLGTEGLVIAGEVRSPERISVGTREQLSTLYRLCLGEYLQTTIVLDDQLVQSDDTRMEWFRGLLADKARRFQIVVFTCRPGDYLAPEAMVVGDGVVWVDSDEGFVRAVDLGRVAGRG
jgi:DNA repair exonuclease SbcCD ATPase subunit